MSNSKQCHEGPGAMSHGASCCTQRNPVLWCVRHTEHLVCARVFSVHSVRCALAFRVQALAGIPQAKH
eukprot:282048-Pelagomonas_calceolata.AAC.1